MNTPGRETSRLGPCFPRSRVTRRCHQPARRPNNLFSDSLGERRDPPAFGSLSNFGISFHTHLHRHQFRLQKGLTYRHSPGMFRNHFSGSHHRISTDPQIQRCFNRGPFFPGISGTCFWTRPVGRGSHFSYCGSLALS
jgi:hypothetical protein